MTTVATAGRRLLHGGDGSAESRLCAAVILLVGTAAVAEILWMAGQPQWGVVVSLPALMSLLLLWRPGPAALAALSIIAGLELVLPLQTGGGRYQDWLLHYEIGLKYAGLHTPITATFLASRTALPHELAGSVLNHWPSYATFQAVSVLLDSIWLWPAALLLREANKEGAGARLLAIALSPFVLSYAVYTWPWGLSAFFLLSGLWLAGRQGGWARAMLGLSLAASVLAHPGSLGYAAGAGAYAVFRLRPLSPTLAGAAAGFASQLPWAFAITGGRGPLQLLASSDPLQQHIPAGIWLVTRALLAVHTVIPVAPLVPQLCILDVVLVFFVLSLPGALLLPWGLLGRWMKPGAGVAAASLALGVPFSWAIDPAQQYSSGMLDALYLAVLVLLVYGTARVPFAAARRLALAQAACAAVFASALLAVAMSATAADPNLRLKLRYGARYLVELLGPAPGLALLLLGTALTVALLRPRTGSTSLPT